VDDEGTICGGGYCGIGAVSGLGGCEPGGDGGFCEWTWLAEGTPCGYFEGGGGVGNALLVWFMNG